MALLNHVKKYCGPKPNLPEGYDRFGDRYSCLKSGIFIGKKLSEAHQKQAVNDAVLESQRHQKEHVQAGFNRGQIVGELKTRKKLATDISKKGLVVLRRDIHLNDLNKDQLRSIATKYTGTNKMIAYYSNMSKQELIDALLDRGFKL